MPLPSPERKCSQAYGDLASEGCAPCVRSNIGREGSSSREAHGGEPCGRRRRGREDGGRSGAVIPFGGAHSVAQVAKATGCPAVAQPVAPCGARDRAPDPGAQPRRQAAFARRNLR